MDTKAALSEAENFKICCVLAKVISLADADTKNFGNLFSGICIRLTRFTAIIWFHVRTSFAVWQLFS